MPTGIPVPSFQPKGFAGFKDVSIERSHAGRVARITWNPPKRLNPLTVALTDELMAAVEEVKGDEMLHVVVFRGAGGFFCCGDDLIEMHEGLWGNPNQVMRRIRYYQQFAQQIEELDKTTIAVVEGFALGGGLETAMACDFVLAAESAQWGEVDNAMTPGWGGTTRMIRYIGRRRTKEVNMIGALRSAKVAVEWGLFNRAVPDHQLEQELQRLIEVLLSKNQQTLRQLKFVINKNSDADMATALAFEAMNEVITSAVNWDPSTPRIPDAEPGNGLEAFAKKNELWNRRRELARKFWAD
ncbi:MAG: enoyl-CoA hydratase/isomerase family protein [Deltaproteobacteria bacterium]|nr:enoyl-CoA hydratase/isomerase family protein [Deltaproteobacteria bacterium]